MSREIKFRGIPINDTNFCYGSLNTEYDNSHSIVFWYSKLIEPDTNYSEPTQDFEQVKSETVGQYTGLKDKNGVDIYEGDIIKIDGSEKILSVIFKKGCFYSINNEVGTNYRLGGWENGSFEVIGNIHQNPELLNNK